MSVSVHLCASDMSKLFSLRSEDFLSHLASSFAHIRSNDLFTDVTLVSDDEQSFLAHKVIIASSSEYFFNRLRNNKNSHQIICLDGMKSEEITNILDFLYYGEVKIDLGSIDRFIYLAKKLKLHAFSTEERDKNIHRPNILPKNSQEIVHDKDLLMNYPSENMFQHDEKSTYLHCNKEAADVIGQKAIKKAVTNMENNIIPLQQPTLFSDNITEKQDADNETRTFSVSSRNTVNNEELSLELEQIQFIRNDQNEPNVYACNNCDLTVNAFYEAKWHYEKHHQNLDAERTILMNLTSYVQRMKKVDNETIEKNFQTYSADIRNKISTLNDINFRRLNPTLQMKYTEIKQWLEMRVNFTSF